ncbi:MAG: hypothetical protein KIT84_15795 [Labilithrix sp.]|nr:hypothetical protein [Labilithrix sp.]MCW5812490.1 hypothetical protein [Labilithrix sp.]
MLARLKGRSPKLFSVLSVALAVGAVGGIAAYERYSSDSCCYAGSPCCYPGSPCCKGHDATAAK